MTTKIPMLCDANGVPLNFLLSGGQVSDIAYAQGGQLYTEENEPFPQVLQSALLEHLNPARQDALQPRVRNALLDLEHYRSQDLTKLMLSTDDPDAAFRYSPPDTSWSDYYALKLLWSHAPQALVNWLSEVCAQPVKCLHPNVLVIEVFKRICLSLGFDKHPVQIEALLHSETSIVNVKERCQPMDIDLDEYLRGFKLVSDVHRPHAFFTEMDHVVSMANTRILWRRKLA